MSKILLKIVYFSGEALENWKHLHFCSDNWYNTLKRFQLAQFMPLQQISSNTEILSRQQAYVTNTFEGKGCEDDKCIGHGNNLLW
jgi:hypothetical protein